MKVVICDLETTGLDESFCQIIEIGMVIDDFKSPETHLPAFHRYVKHDVYCGDPFAFHQNAKIMEVLAFGTSSKITPIGALKLAIWDFLSANFHSEKEASLTFSGKNFASFDLRFLRRICPEPHHPKFGPYSIKHRVLDPGSLYFNPETDAMLPDTKECMKRAGIDGEVPHTALEDCFIVSKMLRNYYAKRSH